MQKRTMIHTTASTLAAFMMASSTYANDNNSGMWIENALHSSLVAMVNARGLPFCNAVRVDGQKFFTAKHCRLSMPVSGRTNLYLSNKDKANKLDHLSIRNDALQAFDKIKSNKRPIVGVLDFAPDDRVWFDEMDHEPAKQGLTKIGTESDWPWESYRGSHILQRAPVISASYIAKKKDDGSWRLDADAQWCYAYRSKNNPHYILTDCPVFSGMSGSGIYVVDEKDKKVALMGIVSASMVGIKNFIPDDPNFWTEYESFSPPFVGERIGMIAPVYDAQRQVNKMSPVTSHDECAEVTARSGVILRTSSSVSADKNGATLPFGMELRIMTRYMPHDWTGVTTPDGRGGYVASDYIKTTGLCVSLKP